MGKAKVILLVVVLAFVAINTSSALQRSKRVRRNENVEKPLIRNTDRSVYARRNFALPDVVSDVYEVYVGPSAFRVSLSNLLTNPQIMNHNCTVEWSAYCKQFFKVLLLLG